jgi:hypothetical protein
VTATDKKNDNKNDGQNGFNPAFGLWNGRGKVAYTTWAKDDIVIPKGAKILAFRNSNATESNRQPTLNVVWVIEDKQ